MNAPFEFLLLLVLCLMVQSFFSMLEMAIVSFNKVRLQYYVSKGFRRAKWLNYLLDHPARLFGTTLIGVNAMLQLGSEAARRFYLSIGVSPDWAALSQTLLVLMFAELSPMFAARRYSEHVAMLGAPVIFICSIVMTPFVWIFNGICHLIHLLMGTKTATYNYLTREELQKAMEEREEGEESEFDQVAQNILSLKQKRVQDLMLPLKKVLKVPVEMTVSAVREEFRRSKAVYVPVYQGSKENIVGIAYPKMLIRAGSEERVRSFSTQPWFISETSEISEVLKQFRYKGQNVAIVLDSSGQAVGILCLDDIISDLFGVSADRSFTGMSLPILIERSFSSQAKIADINRKLSIAIEDHGCETLEELMISQLGHRPNKGESVRVGLFELTMLEAGLFRGKRIEICSR